MKSFKTGILALAVLFTGVAAKAQTADEIVTKHFDALGGKAKIAQIKSIRTESNFEIAGQSAPSITTVLNGKGFKNEIDFGGQKMVQVVTDKGAWMINPMAGQSAPVALPEEQAKSSRDQIFVGGPLLDYASKGYKVELAGREDVKGVNAFKLKVSKDGTESFYYFDPTSYYLIKRVLMVDVEGQKTETATFFSNYKKTDFGYFIPYTMEIVLPQISLVSNVTKVDINQPVAETIFNQ